MRAASGPRRGGRMLIVDPAAGRWADAAVEALPAFLHAGDVLVLNDAGTFPAALRGTVAGEAAELRLLAFPDVVTGEALAVLFGAGDWRTPTERRPPPPHGDLFVAGDGPAALVAALAPDPRSPRLFHVRFDRTGAALVHAIFARGRPVQYSYLADDVALAAVQTPFAGRPWSAEMPSAGRGLSATVLAAARARGVALATLTHAASLSATGDDTLDALLPFPERYDLPAATLRAIATARAHGGRVVAVGTTVARALEGAARTGLRPGPGVTDLVLDADTPFRVVDGLVSGIHVPGESHFRVLAAAVSSRGSRARSHHDGDELLRAAVTHAEDAGYLAHEFGDATLVLPGALAAGRLERAA